MKTATFFRNLHIGLVAAAIVVTTPVAMAQDGNVERRVDRLEREMRAVQRKVFPGGDGTYFEPEIPNPQARPAGPGSTAPLTDVLARLDALESELSRLTGQVEGLENRQRIMGEQIATYRSATEARIAALENSAQNPASEAESTAPAAGTPSQPDLSSARVALVRAVEVPDTGDAGEDAYLYGYRLWDAELYPEAQIQLRKAVADHPSHRRVSYAQNLLGRAYLDNGENGLAARAFVENYQQRPDSARAPDSLMYLGIALDRLGQKDGACRAFAELNDVYGNTISPSLKAQADRAAGEAECS